MKQEQKAPALLEEAQGANVITELHDKDNTNSLYIQNFLYIQFLGEFLHTDTLTIEQLNEGYNIRNAEKIIQQLVEAASVELVPNTNPKEYRTSNRLPEGWEI